MTSPAPQDAEVSSSSPSISSLSLPLPPLLLHEGLESTSPPPLNRDSEPTTSPVPDDDHAPVLATHQERPPSSPPPSPTSCAVCYEVFDPSNRATLSPCGHCTFCKTCITKWVSRPQDPTCPLCRTAIASINDGAVPIPPVQEEFLVPNPFWNLFALDNGPLGPRWTSRRPGQVQPPWRAEGEDMGEEDSWTDTDVSVVSDIDDAQEAPSIDYLDDDYVMPPVTLHLMQLVSERRAFHARARRALARQPREGS